MPRINVEDELFIDPRFKALTKAVGCEYRAIGLCVSFWRIAQQYWCKKKSLIPLKMWEFSEFKVLAETGFAEVREEGVYACGSEDQFKWYRQRIDAGSAGGKISSSKRKQTEANASNGNPLTLPLTLTHKKREKYNKSEATTGYGRAQNFSHPLIEIWSRTIPGKPVSTNLDLIQRCDRYFQARHDKNEWERHLTDASKNEWLMGQWWFDLSWLLKNDTNVEKLFTGAFVSDKTREAQVVERKQAKEKEEYRKHREQVEAEERRIKAETEAKIRENLAWAAKKGDDVGF